MTLERISTFNFRISSNAQPKAEPAVLEATAAITATSPVTGETILPASQDPRYERIESQACPPGYPCPHPIWQTGVGLEY